MSPGSVRLLAALALAAVLPAQDSRPVDPKSPEGQAAAIFDRIDARVYSAEAAGLKSVAFSYRPPASGPRETTPFRVDVRWEQGGKPSVAFRQPDGTEFAELPEILRQPSAVAGTPSARETFEHGARALVELFRGVPYSARFAKWNKRLETRVVNGREEKTIVCEPAAAGYFRRAEIALDPKDLPWRTVHYLARAESGMERMVDEPAWSEFDGKLLMTSFKKTWGAQEEQIVVKYERKDGFFVPSSYERLVAGKEPVRFLFVDVILNAAAESTPVGK